jgi:hypothetical protein
VHFGYANRSARLSNQARQGLRHRLRAPDGAQLHYIHFDHFDVLDPRTCAHAIARTKHAARFKRGEFAGRKTAAQGSGRSGQPNQTRSAQAADYRARSVINMRAS